MVMGFQMICVAYLIFYYRVILEFCGGGIFICHLMVEDDLLRILCVNLSVR